jgi:ATP-binding cassette subfamily C exporter for protease/lipase
MTKRDLARDELATAVGSLRGAFVTVAVFSGFLNVLMLVPSLYMMQIYDRVLGSRNETTLWVLTMLVVASYAFMSTLEAIRTWVLVRVGARLDAQMGARVFNTSFERKLRHADSNAAQPLQDLNAVRQTLTGPGLLAVFDAPWMPVYLVVITLFAWQLGVFALAGAIALTILAVVNEKTSKPRLAEAQKYSFQAQMAINNHLRNAEVIQSMGMLDNIRGRWHALHLKQLQLQAVASDQAAVMSGLTKFIRISMQSLSLGIGALLVLENQMSAGMMIAASILVSRALAPAELLVAHWKQIVLGRAAYDRLRQLLVAHPPRPVGMALPAPTGKVSLEGVAVMAPGGQRPILRNINFALDAGTSVAIIGPSGSGKSTLARALVGIWPVTAGTVRLDGADLHNWRAEDLGPHIGYLPQDIELFDGTVAENIARFGDIDSDQVILAARRTGMHEAILQMPQGYDTPLGAGGSALSGGQRQRIGIARALYGNPALIVLDEPNSNLDEQGERALMETVQGLNTLGKTTVLITHRVSALAVVAKIMVLKDGMLAAFGPRDEVLEAMKARAQKPATTPAPTPTARALS